MIEVRFYDNVDDHLLKFAVIVARYKGKWVLCKHKERDTYECPGGHREKEESILGAAQRELWEESGAVQYDLKKVCVYSVIREDQETFGMLYFAEIEVLEELPDLEIEKIEFFDVCPNKWTYPLIQPKLMEKVKAELGFDMTKLKNE